MNRTKKKIARPITGKKNLNFFYFIFILLLFIRLANASTISTPSDLNDILQRIVKRQSQTSSVGRHSKISFNGDQNDFVKESSDVDMDVSPGGKNFSIMKYFLVKTQAEAYKYAAFLQPVRSTNYEHLTTPVEGGAAMVFFNDDEVFVYMPRAQKDGHSSFKEWIYARKPNASDGSKWTWIFKSDDWQWPLTMQVSNNSTTAIDRNVPLAGISYDEKARYNYMLQMMLKLKSGDQVKKYFPFNEEIGSIAAPYFWTNEGIGRQTNISISNTSIIDENRPKPKHGLDFGQWNEYWETIYKVSVSAKPNEYPLLIEP